MGNVIVAPANEIKRVRIELKQDISTGKIIKKNEYEIKNQGEYHFADNEGMAGRDGEAEDGEGTQREEAKEENVCLKKYIKI